MIMGTCLLLLLQCHVSKRASRKCRLLAAGCDSLRHLNNLKTVLETIEYCSAPKFVPETQVILGCPFVVRKISRRLHRRVDPSIHGDRISTRMVREPTKQTFVYFASLLQDQKCHNQSLWLCWWVSVVGQSKRVRSEVFYLAVHIQRSGRLPRFMTLHSLNSIQAKGRPIIK